MPRTSPPPPGATHPSGPRRASWIGAALVVLALAIRLPGMDWGLPLVEEEAFPLFKALQRSGWGGGETTLDPETAGWPTLSFYAHMALQRVHHVLGGFENGAAYLEAFLADKSTLVVASRGFGLAASVLVVVIGWIVGKRLAGVPLGLVIALVLVVLRPLLVAAHRITPDAFVIAFSALALERMLRAHESGRLRDFVLAGAWIGLGASAKYVPLLFLPALLLTVGLRVRGEGSARAGSLGDPRWWAPLAACVAAFALTSPLLVADPGMLTRGLEYQERHMTEGHFGSGPGGGVPFYLGRVLVPAFGWPGLALALAGLAAGVFTRRDRRWWILAAYTLPVLVVFPGLHTRFSHYMWPAMLPLALGLGGLRWLAPPERLPRAALRGAGVAMAAVLATVPPALASWTYLREIGRPSTHLLATRWIDAHAGENSLLALEYQTLPFYEENLQATPHHSVYLPLVSEGPQASAPFYDIRWFSDFDFVLTSAAVRNRYTAEPARHAEQNRFYADLEHRWREAARFGGADVRGPEIVVYANPVPPRERVSAIPGGVLEGLARGNNPYAERFLSHTADALMAAERPLNAGRVLNLLTHVCRDCGDAYAKLGLVSLMLKMHAESADAFSQHLTRFPEDTEIYVYLAMAHHGAGHYDDAARALETALRLDPGHEQAQRMLEALRTPGTQEQGDNR